MSDTLRILLLISSLITGGWILYKIRKLQVKMQDAIFWVIFALILFGMGVFPKACYWLTELFGIMSPANLIFLVVIFLLMEKVFTLSIIVSQLEEKVSVLAIELALRTGTEEKREKQNEREEEVQEAQDRQTKAKEEENLENERRQKKTV